MRLLLIEDDQQIASFIADGLKQAGFAVDHAADGASGLDMALTTTYDAAIVDLMLPRLDGLSLIDRLRQKRVNTPVLILSAKGALDHRIEGLQRGGDDYMVKPFAFSELLVRVQALIRRSTGTVEASQLTYSDLSLDLYKREVYRAGKRIDLRQREFALLEYLMRNAERPLSRTMILERIWDFHFDPQTNVVDVLVCRLRTKIDRDFSNKLIHTLRGVGYVLKDAPAHF
jgi:DNA-binding response OmpR family regulator